jgi:hypothetical protein
MAQEEQPMVSAATLQYELAGRFDELEVGKTHLSVRWEPAPGIARVGAMIERYDWDNRMSAIRALLAFQSQHADEFAVEFDVLPLDAVQSDDFAEA